MATIVSALVALSSMSSSPISPRMLGVFGDGMVLQHDQPIIHGCGARPHDRIAACVGPCKDEIVRGVADADGCFTLHLEPRPVFSGNRSSTLSIAVKISTGNASSPFFAHAHGVTFGHVILCGGQSNMVHPLSYDYNATEQIAAASRLPNLRLFQVGRQWSNNSGAALPLGCNDNKTAPTLHPACASGLRNIWRSPTPNGDPGASSFSAVCYLTAQELMRNEWGENASVGLVEADWGGSNMATWQTREFVVTRGGCEAEPPSQQSCPLTTAGISPIRGNNWGCLLHGMIQPLTRSLRPSLTLWYQGESNSHDDPFTYRCQLEAMIAEWRLSFNSTSLPFFLVQLAPYWQGKLTGATFPAIRIAQAQAVKTVMAETGVASGYCVTHDLGDHAGGIHPHNKTEVARRLAIEIRAKVFGAQDLPRIPEVSSACTNKNSPNRLEISFEPTVSDLRWGGTHNCTECCTINTTVVEVCAANNCTYQNSVAWTPIAARWEYKNGSHFLTADALTGSKAVRYAWSNYPECVLFDSEGLPVPPFNQSISAC